MWQKQTNQPIAFKFVIVCRQPPHPVSVSVYSLCCCPLLCTVTFKWAVIMFVLSLTPSIIVGLIKTALFFQVATETVEYMSWSASEKVGQIRALGGCPFTPHCCHCSNVFIFFCYTFVFWAITCWSAFCFLHLFSVIPASVHCYVKTQSEKKNLKMKKHATYKPIKIGFLHSAHILYISYYFGCTVAIYHEATSVQVCCKLMIPFVNIFWNSVDY